MKRSKINSHIAAGIEFYGRGGTVLAGEVSRVNDDTNDNRFLEPLPRFPAIEEDEAPLHLLCTEYPPAQG